MKLDLVRSTMRTVVIASGLLAACGGRPAHETNPQAANRIEPVAPAASSSDREREAAYKGAEQTTAAHQEQDKAAADKQSISTDRAAQQKADEDKAAADKAIAEQAAAQAAADKAAADEAAQKKAQTKTKTKTKAKPKQPAKPNP